MDLQEFLRFCESKSIVFSVIKNQLKIVAPENTISPDILEKLQFFKPHIINWLNKSEIANNTSLPVINRVDRASKHRASPGQEQIWLANRLHKTGDIYHFLRVIEFSGSLDIKIFDKIFTDIVQRHEALRTVLFEENGVILQKVINASNLNIPVRDVSALSAEQQKAISNALQQELLEKPFDLAKDMMLRLHIIHFGCEFSQLIIVVHHAASDGWSLSLLVDEIRKLYLHYATANESQLPALPIQYIDYSQWLRTASIENKLSASIDFWEKYLVGVPETHNLPLDYIRPAIQSFQGDRVLQSWDNALYSDLKNLARKAGATLFMTLEYLYAVYISRCSQSNDVVIGTPVANRSHEDIEGLIGYFANILPLRHKINSSSSFLQQLDTTRLELAEAFTHQSVPTEKIIQSAIKSRSSSHSPLIQIAFSYQNNIAPELIIPGLTCRILGLQKKTSQFDLQLDISEGADKINLCWEYSSELFDRETIGLMSDRFEFFVRQLLKNPEVPISEISMLLPIEEHKILNEWNNIGEYSTSNVLIHEIFQQQANMNPDNVAVDFGEEKLTYSQLHKKSNQLARFLVENANVKPGSVVGVCVDRSLDMIITLLAILKAGAAYVPLDPDYPVSRLTYMIRDAKLGLVICKDYVVRPLHDVNVHFLEINHSSIRKKISLMDDADLDTSTLKFPESTLAYVIYTSGSTGEPKGVMVDHQAVIRLVIDTNYIALSAESVIAQASNMSFDAMTFEVWGALLNGGKLVYVDKNTLLNGASLKAKIKDTNINTLFITTALFNAIANSIPDAFAELEYLLFGGEDCSIKEIRKVIEQGKPKKLLHMYGPTENTTFSLWKELTWDIAFGNTKIPLGRPINNTAYYVVDEKNSLVPFGLSGELLLGGMGLSKGYLFRPELTSERFINHFLENENLSHDCSLLYRTGDLVRCLKNGDIEFVGRFDNQVKIRGFRIELGEIESKLKEQKMVRDAVVLKVDASGTSKLVAYVSINNPNLEGFDLDKQSENRVANALRDLMAKSLPEYMIPSAFVILEKIPLTPNGKTDKQKLLEMEVAVAKDEYTEPATDIERILSQIWYEVLGCDLVGTQDNFFYLGGDSLLAMKVIAIAKEKLKINIPINTFFENPTVSGISIYIESIIENEKQGALMNDFFEEGVL